MNEEESVILHGDALTVLKTLESESVDMCVTSPPYFGLRDYGVDGQIGLEDTPEQYISRLVDVFREVRRVLRDDGTLWLNIGDSYNGSQKGSGGTGKISAKQNSNKGANYAYGGKPLKMDIKGLKAKDLIGIPWMLAFALRADGWYLRQDIIWAKPNPMPESVRDRCTKSHEYIFLLSKSPRYYFDAEAIAEPVADTTIKRLSQDVENQMGYDRAHGGKNMKAVPPRYGGNKYTACPDVFSRTKSGNAYDFRSHRNKRDVWTVSTQPYSGAHFAVFPPKLITPCILAGCPEGGTVLDPFFGSGTTGEVAARLMRKWIGIELNAKYIEIAKRRTSQTTLNYSILPHK
jgi:DNA modification methylase